MTVSYKKLWHLLLDKNMKKKDLQEAAGLTQYAMLKLGCDEDCIYGDIREDMSSIRMFARGNYGVCIK